MSRSSGFGRVRAALFPRAARYGAPGGSAAPAGVHEAARGLAAPETERALQCVWFDPSLRPGAMRTAAGEPVFVEHPGEWNLRAGPDFIGAALRIGVEKRRIEGDVEIHVRPSDWTAHGHARDPRYARVRAHVTFFPGRLPPEELPPGAVQIALRDALAADPAFTFDHIDLSAYPYAAPATPAPCALVLADWTPDDKEALLAAAGEERLRRKAERLAIACAERGAETAFYEEYLTALGYPENKAPFRRLAAALPLDTLRAIADGDPLRAEALLAGMADLLPAAIESDWSEAARRHARALWDHWWKIRPETGGLNRSAWQRSGVRPANHPVRRIAGAAWFLTRKESPVEGLRRCAAQPDPVSALLNWLDVRSDTFWGVHSSLTAPRSPHPIALIGRSRATAILINVAVPMAAALDLGALFADGGLHGLPPEAPSDRLRAIAHTLFGPGHPPSLYRSGLRRQGLLQIFHDYCLHNRSHCAECGFPTWLRERNSSL